MLTRETFFLRSLLCVTCALFVMESTVAQSGASRIVNDLDVKKARQEHQISQPRELTVLTETLSAEQIDRAVLNRLMQEISTEPEKTKQRLSLNESQLQEFFITLSNARGFINGSEMANVRAMCAAWNASTSEGDGRVQDALSAYQEREEHTQAFIAKYYHRVLLDIESQLDKISLPRFRDYMDDRRRRLANAGMTSWGSPVQNIRAGTDTIDFHCR